MEHCTGIKEVKVLILFRPFHHYCVSSTYNCKDHLHRNCFNPWFKYTNIMYSSHHRIHKLYIYLLSMYRLALDPHNAQLPVGLIAQLVKPCTSIAEVRVWVRFGLQFFRPFPHSCLMSAHYCKDNLQWNWNAHWYKVQKQISTFHWLNLVMTLPWHHNIFITVLDDVLNQPQATLAAFSIYALPLHGWANLFCLWPSSCWMPETKHQMSI